MKGSLHIAVAYIAPLISLTQQDATQHPRYHEAKIRGEGKTVHFVYSVQKSMQSKRVDAAGVTPPHYYRISMLVRGYFI
jgi:hypothetical protein